MAKGEHVGRNFVIPAAGTMPAHSIGRHRRLVPVGNPQRARTGNYNSFDPMLHIDVSGDEDEEDTMDPAPAVDDFDPEQASAVDVAKPANARTNRRRLQRKRAARKKADAAEHEKTGTPGGDDMAAEALHEDAGARRKGATTVCFGLLAAAFIALLVYALMFGW